MDAIAVAKIVGCFGVKGYLKLLPMTHQPERLDDLRDVEIGSPAGDRVPDRIEKVVHQHDQILVKLKGVPDRTAAEQYVGKYVFIAAGEARPPDKGSYFVHEIVGCEVWSTEGAFVGVLTDVYKMSAQDLWEVKSGSKVHLIPAVKEFVTDVDMAKRRITVRLLEGLVEE